MKKTKSVYEFKEDADRYYEAAMDASADGNLFYALKCANEAVRIEPTCLEYRFLVGEIYYEMGLCDRAVDINLEVLALDPEVEESYYYCMRAFAEMGKYDAAFFYLQEGLKHGLLESGIVDIEQLNAIKVQQSEFRVVTDEDQSRELLNEAKNRLAAGYSAAALDALSAFRKDMPLYEQALVIKADCYGDARADSAVLTLEAPFRETGDSLLGAALAHYLYADGRAEEAEAVLEAVAPAPDASFDERKRFVLAYSDLDRTEDALRVADAAADLEPNDADLILLRASVLSRINRCASAQNALQELLILDPLDSVAMYWNECIQNGETLPKNIFALPEREIERRVAAILEWADADEKTLRLPMPRSRLAALRWAIKLRLLAEYDDFDLLSALSESEDVEVLLRDLCVDHDIAWDVRRLCAAVLCFCVDANVTLRVADEYTVLDCRAPSKIKNDDFLMRSWAIALATLAFSAKNYEKPLREVYTRLAEHPTIDKIDDAQLAAVVIVGFVLKMEQVFADEEHDGILSGLIRDLKEIETPLRELLPVMFP